MVHRERQRAWLFLPLGVASRAQKAHPLAPGWSLLLGGRNRCGPGGERVQAGMQNGMAKWSLPTLGGAGR